MSLLKKLVPIAGLTGLFTALTSLVSRVQVIEKERTNALHPDFYTAILHSLVGV